MKTEKLEGRSENLKLDSGAKSLRDTSFKRATSKVKRRLIMAIDAERGSGKTHFPLTAPGPIAYLNIDQNSDGVVQKFQDKKEIYVTDIALPEMDAKNTDAVAEQACEIWQSSFCHDYLGAVRDSKVRTIVIDTGTETWELLRLALYGKLTQVISRDYGHANAIYSRLIREVVNTDKNLIITHKLTDEYVNDKSTGRRKRAGFKWTGNLVQVEMELWKVPGEPFPDKFHGLITKCTQQPEAEECELVGKDLCYDSLLEMVFP